VPDRAGRQERSGTVIKLTIRVLIRESECPNLGGGGRPCSEKNPPA
jgi:hypothetical protein